MSLICRHSTSTPTRGHTPYNSQYRVYWEDTYRLINRANIIIEGVTQAIADGIISDAQGNIYLGEARFFRAISHLELLFPFCITV